MWYAHTYIAARADFLTRTSCSQEVGISTYGSDHVSLSDGNSYCTINAMQSHCGGSCMLSERKQLVDLCGVAVLLLAPGSVSLFSTSLRSADVVKVHFNRV